MIIKLNKFYPRSLKIQITKFGAFFETRCISMSAVVDKRTHVDSIILFIYSITCVHVCSTGWRSADCHDDIVQSWYIATAVFVVVTRRQCRWRLGRPTAPSTTYTGRRWRRLRRLGHRPSSREPRLWRQLATTMSDVPFERHIGWRTPSQPWYHDVLVP